jgi:hypothetical protein
MTLFLNQNDNAVNDAYLLLSSLWVNKTHKH